VVQVLGLDVSKGMLLVYDGNKAEIYKVGWADQHQGPSWLCTSNALP
jgi:hypothetical protein